MKNIYEKFSKIDLSAVVEKKMSLTYLSWAKAWDIVMQHYPESNFEILEPVRLDDGSMEVWVSVTIDGHTRKMWLPVMDNKNNSIIKPTSRQVSDARMRCLVKCLAMFGLGLYIYQGEDLPRQDEPADVMTAIKEIMTQNSLQDLTQAFKRLTKGHSKDSTYVQKLTQAAKNRKEEIQNGKA